MNSWCSEVVWCFTIKRLFTTHGNRMQLSPHQHDIVLVCIMKSHVCHFATCYDDICSSISYCFNLRIHEIFFSLAKIHQFFSRLYQYRSLAKQTSMLLRTILLRWCLKSQSNIVRNKDVEKNMKIIIHEIRNDTKCVWNSNSAYY